MKPLNELTMKEHEAGKEAYKKELKQLQKKMLNLQQNLLRRKVGLILAFEGMDAAGKGGAIKRLTAEMDPRGYVVHPITAPQPHELRYHYLHRFWRKLPQHGQTAIFDRSWYGRVLVERVEGYAEQQEWQRAYGEIAEFERTLVDEQYIMIKFWLHITPDEQLERFEDRMKDPYKRWKITEEDWRNRDKWEQYEQAAEDMLQKTDSELAPWEIIGANDKKHARLEVMRRTTSHIEEELKRRGFEILKPDELYPLSVSRDE
ncbi:polyphosphate kinase 2 family protein [Planococcus lenghuensis]|uniref:Polyphosphate kinase-2-related domain-containing protein n=1 Tax=Planococcus lenghuensis TaxID=2213202 RepID=A0A1Q2KXD4_9BACL|nr:hypothetical protein [Planococcus lenghuensis]AQQ52477.1 hypothetical protein B0X71_04705 [Planococcus lenghuensis]